MTNNIKIVTPKTSNFHLAAKCVLCKAPKTLMLSFIHMHNSELGQSTRPTMACSYGKFCTIKKCWL